MMPKELQRFDTVTLITIAVRIIAILLLTSVLSSIVYEFFLAFTWKFNPYGEIPNAWYPMTNEWRYTWGDEIAQVFIAPILWLSSRPIAQRISLNSTPNACPQCSYPKADLQTDQCPECNFLWNTKDQPMNKQTLHNTDLFLLVASAIRLLAFYIFALALVSLGGTLVALIGSNFAIMETLKNLWWYFTDFSEFSIWIYIIPKLTIATTLWVLNKRIAHWIIPKST